MKKLRKAASNSHVIRWVSERDASTARSNLGSARWETGLGTGFSMCSDSDDECHLPMAPDLRTNTSNESSILRIAGIHYRDGRKQSASQTAAESWKNVVARWVLSAPTAAKV